MDVDEVRKALDAGYTMTECALSLGMHRVSLWKAMKEHDPHFRAYPTYTIDEVCNLITREVPLDGYGRDWGIRFVKAKLKRSGYTISRHMVRDALDQLLPGVLEQRSRKCISRRIYDVTEPMHVWHMDCK